MAQAVKPTDFYASALTEAERLRLPEARSVDGLDEEIVLLRVKLYQAALEHPEQFELLLKGVNSLVRLVAMRYKLSDKPAQELSESIAGVIRGVGGALYPERFTDG